MDRKSATKEQMNLLADLWGTKGAYDLLAGAAELGLPTALVALGNIAYLEGDLVAAEDHWKRGLERGIADPKPCFPVDLALAFALDLEEKGDRDGARRLYRIIADLGVATAYVQLFCMATSEGFPATEAERIEARTDWETGVELAKKNNDQDALFSIAMVFETGGAPDQYDEEAINDERNWYLRSAAQLGHPAAQYLLADSYRYGHTGLDRDEEKFLIWIRKSIELGFEEALLDYVDFLVEQKKPVDSEEKAWLESKAVQSAKAQERLGRLRLRERE